jgi:peptidoglycan/LPS O-acetylase OafA/YrhL
MALIDTQPMSRDTLGEQSSMVTPEGPPPRRARLAQVDLLKGWSILGVIFIHMSFASRFGSDAMQAITVLQRLFAWAVVAFLFCAGFLFAKSSAVGQDARSYVPKRARRLLLPWIGFTLIYNFLLLAAYRFHFITSPIPVRFDDTHWHQFIQFITWQGAPQLYFLPYLFLISVLCHLLCGAIRREWALWLGALLLTAVSGWLDSGEPHGGEWVHFPAYAATYLAGVLVAKPAFLLPVRQRRLFFGVIAGCFVALCLARPMLAYLAAPLAALPLQRFVPGAVAPLVSYLGRRSGPIYVWHTPIIMPFLSIVLAKWFFATPWLLIPVFTALTIVLSLAVARAVRVVDRHGILTM